MSKHACAHLRTTLAMATLAAFGSAAASVICSRRSAAFSNSSFSAASFIRSAISRLSAPCLPCRNRTSSSICRS